MGKSALGIIQKYHPNVTRVTDAKKAVTVAVTASDCKSSRKKAPDACAMARACQREYDGAVISMSVAYLIKGNEAIRYKVPDSVSRELVSFDRHKNFAPGEYWLNAPTESTKLGPRTAPMRPDRSHYPSTKRRNHHTAGIRAL